MTPGPGGQPRRNAAFPTGDEPSRGPRRVPKAAVLVGPLVFVAAAVAITLVESGRQQGIAALALPTSDPHQVVGVDSTTPAGTCLSHDTANSHLLRVADCGTVHEGVVLGAQPVDDADTAGPYPGDGAWHDVLVRTCRATALSWVGGTTLPATVRVSGLYPVSARWVDGDRTVTCLLYWQSPRAGDARGLATASPGPSGTA